jgi:hypothetical protein
MNRQAMIQELALQKAVRRQMDAIVRAANAAAALLEGSNMEKNQIRNVLNVAEEEPSSVAVVTNFIRYQIGRSRTGQEWQHQGFGLRVADDIEREGWIVDKATQNAVSYARDLIAQRGGQVDEAELKQKVRQQLIRYYLGYLHRAFYFGNETNQWDELRKAAEA